MKEQKDKQNKLYNIQFKHITDHCVGNPYTFKKGTSYTPSNKPILRPRKLKTRKKNNKNKRKKTE